MLKTLVDCDALATLLGRSDVCVVDCRFDLAKPAWGGAEYWRGHIPGAIYAHLDRDLSAPITATSGRHPLPDPQVLARRFADWGIGHGMQVVAYDQGNGMVAARLWWLLRWLGLASVAVLDGGYAAWTAPPSAGATALPVSRDVVSVVSRILAPRVRRDWLVSTEQLAAAVAQGLAPQQLFDARAADRFAGQNETIDSVAGHVPGACNAPFAANLGADGRWLSAAALRERWTTLLGDTPPRNATIMCGSGVSACHNLLALEHAGLGGAKLYAGSWSEWIRDPTRPVAR
jgi:thiosulfate/3-mercaptopyruvate sulfurtransferase